MKILGVAQLAIDRGDDRIGSVHFWIKLIDRAAGAGVVPGVSAEKEAAPTGDRVDASGLIDLGWIDFAGRTRRIINIGKTVVINACQGNEGAGGRDDLGVGLARFFDRDQAIAVSGDQRDGD